MFDPYHKWLGIPLEQRPPTYYQLLGISMDEQDPEVIEEAAIRQSAHVRIYQTGPHAEESARLLGEIARARSTLLKPEKRKKYDSGLGVEVGSKSKEMSRAATSAAAAPAEPVATESREPAFRPRPAVLEPKPNGGYPAPLPAPAAAVKAKSRQWILLGVIGCGAILGFGVGLSMWLLKSYTSTGKTPNAETVVSAQPTAAAPPTKHIPDEVTPAKPPEQVQNEPRRFEGHTTPIGCVAIAPDGKYALSGGGSRTGRDGPARPVDCTLRLWDLQTGKEVRQLKGHTAPVHAVAFSADGQFALSAAGAQEDKDDEPVAIDCTVRLWAVDLGKEVGAFEGHTGPVRAVGFVGKNTAVSAGSDGTIRLWDLEKREEVRKFDNPPGAVKCLAVSADGKQMISGHSDKLGVLWDVSTGKEVRRLEGAASPIHGVAFSPNGKFALTGTGTLETKDEQAKPLDCVVRLWDVAKGQVLRSFDGHTGPVLSVVFSKEGGHALSASEDKTVRLWDVDTGKELKRFEGHKSAVTAVALAADDKRALSGGGDGSLRPWDLPAELLVAKTPNPAMMKPEMPMTPEKDPVPDAEAQKEAEKKIKDAYKTEYAKTSSADRKKFADKLLQTGLVTNDDPVARYVLLREAMDLAMKAGDADLALQAINEVDKEYAINAFDLKLAVLEKVVKLPSPPATGKDVLADHALAAVEEAVAADNYEVAAKFLTFAETAAKKTNTGALLKRVQERNKELAEQRKEFTRVLISVEALKKQADDPDANLVVGKYYCLVKGNWDKGLPYLALGKDAKLQAIAKKEAAKPEDAATQVELGDSWWDLAEGQKGLAKVSLQRRAQHWYRLAIGDLMGFKKDQVAQRLKILNKDLPKLAGKWDHLDIGNATVMNGYVRINRRKAISTREAYSGPIEITVVVRTEKENIRLQAPQGAAVIFNQDYTRKELLIHRPDGNRNYESGQQQVVAIPPLAPNVWHTIRWRITEKGMDVTLVTLNNRILLFADKRNYDLTTEQPVRIATRDSFVDVKSLAVQVLK